MVKLQLILLRTGLNLEIMMDECRNVSYGKRAKEELDKEDGTQFIIFPINDRDKAYVLDREILYLVQPWIGILGMEILG